jgi:hypothetical protein
LFPAACPERTFVLLVATCDRPAPSRSDPRSKGQGRPDVTPDLWPVPHAIAAAGLTALVGAVVMYVLLVAQTATVDAHAQPRQPRSLIEA